MTGAEIVTPPIVLWAQRKDRLYLTISLEDIQNKKLQLKEKCLEFSGTGGTDKKPHAVTINFFKEVVPEDSKQLQTDREIVMSIKKKEDGPYWPRLMEVKGKYHFLKTDFNRWVDEDDSDDEGGARERNLEEMMAQLGGGFNDSEIPPTGDEGLDDPEDAADSDDEELPDLE